MKSIKDLVDDLRILIDANSDELDDRTLISWINGQRAWWLKNEANKGRVLEDSVVQTLPCLSVSIVDASI